LVLLAVIVAILITPFSECKGTFTVNIPANNGSSSLTDTNGEAVEPVKKMDTGRCKQ
jgi:hypothetical protein